MFKHILVPTDGSERSEYAARFAVELAKLHGAAPRGPAGSKLTRLLIKLIAEDGRDGGGAATSAGPSALTTHLRTILEPSDVPDAEPPAARG